MFINVFYDHKNKKYYTLESEIHRHQHDAAQDLIDWGMDDYDHTINAETGEKLDLAETVKEIMSEPTMEEWHDELRAEYHANLGLK